MDTSEHLFRHESGRILAALTRLLGFHNLALAEDILQEAFCRAIEVWQFRGMPENPAAWLMATAKHCAVDALRRERSARRFAPEIARLMQAEKALAPDLDSLSLSSFIQDDLLRMMFSCCHPGLAQEAQVMLILHTLCGFSTREVASAFITGEATVEKRISRSKKVLARSKRLFDVTAAKDMTARLPAVQRALYLLFSEGYHSSHRDLCVRMDLCNEAMRLTAILLENKHAARPSSYALAALMCLHAARLPARVDERGNLNVLAEQDRSRWDRALLAEGFALLDMSASGTQVSPYHLEAAIASVHAAASSSEETNWPRIIELYDALNQIAPSAIVSLNRAIAIAEAEGSERGMEEMWLIPDTHRLAQYPFYAAALGELEFRRGQHENARLHFRKAAQLARNDGERHFLNARVKDCCC
jgi:RNA polymerase sigma factor (sigma-70 family)